MGVSPPSAPGPDDGMASRADEDGSVCPHCGGALHATGGGPQGAAATSRLVRGSSSLGLEAERSTPEEHRSERDPLSPSHPDPLVGMVIAGRYRMLQCIGRGGMGLIYKVEHVEIGKLLALKLLAGEYSSDKRIVRRFRREALLVSRLSHPNTVQVFDYGSHEGLTWLVMELVNGKDLAFVLKTEGPMRATRLVPIIVQVCSSLAEAHGLGIVHRDIKLGNIMVTPCCQDGADLVKVLDFGLAKLKEAPELAEVTGTGGLIGTPHYMAPELISGQTVDARADIYALGAVMYRTLTGDPVFSASTPAALFQKHLYEKPMAPHLHAPQLGIAESLSAIVLRALEKNPADRFQRVEDLQSALIGLDVIGPPKLSVLMDAARLHALQQDASQAARSGAPEPPTAAEAARRRAATRDEVAAYERKLKRARWTGTLVAAIVFAAGAMGAVRLYRFAKEPPGFRGEEVEPNNSAMQANNVPFGQPVRARLGKRLDREHGDRDFFRIQIPTDAAIVSIQTSALPNMAMCTHLYETATDQLQAKFCTGNSGLDLVVPAFRLAPGTYYFAALQDRDHSGAEAQTPILENVSDDYVLTVTRANVDPSRELEPNDSSLSADELPIDHELTGMLGWVDDVDFVCAAASVPESSQRVRWIVRDALGQPRETGVVLDVTPSYGSRAGIAFHVHRANATAAVGIDDRVSPWKSEPFVLSPQPRAQCLRLQLAADPWTRTDAPVGVSADHAAWNVRLQSVP
jgi:eukaryotic-like serine/threonine-protein kinase